jgi:hypothetical protein
MFQPRVKLEFVRRYCPPQDGWCVCVDIDASEEGRTGSPRASDSARERQAEMQADAARVRDEFKGLGASVGNRKPWCTTQGVPYLEGDPDIVAYDRIRKRCIVAEVEGASSGQPEQKLYKAIGQIVRTASQLPQGWRCYLVVVVYGDKIAAHLERAKALETLNIAALHLQDRPDADRWLFGATWMDPTDEGEAETYLRQPQPLTWDERLAEKDKALIGELNAALNRLNERRAIEINVAGPFARSKIAWKLAVHQHGLLHRLIALMDGAAVAWNNRCTLSAILTARALMETTAVMSALADRVADLLANEDLSALDALAEHGTFSSRDIEWLKEAPEAKAVNVLTYIDRFDKRAEGFRGHYDILSERCHPNAFGHTFMFAKLDQSNGSVRFVDEREPERNGQMILAALAVFPLVESLMNRLDELIVKVSDLHHRVAPVGRAASAAEPPQAGSEA